MNASQIHLALTHIPVILSFTGLVILFISIVKKNSQLTRVSFLILLLAGLGALPVFFSGEGAEETVEHLPGVSGSLIERHEEIAKISFYTILGTGFIALVGLFNFSIPNLGKTVRFLTLFFALGSSALMVQTAHLGGQIRHSEIRPGFAQAGENPETIDPNKEDGEND
jgi:biotin transporter BioY